MSVRDRFLRYVTIDTRSDERSTAVPSTPGQLVLLRRLVSELRELGIEDAGMDEHGYVTTSSYRVPCTRLIIASLLLSILPLHGSASARRA